MHPPRLLSHAQHLQRAIPLPSLLLLRLHQSHPWQRPACGLPSSASLALLRQRLSPHLCPLLLSLPRMHARKAVTDAMAAATTVVAAMATAKRATATVVSAASALRATTVATAMPTMATATAMSAAPHAASKKAVTATATAAMVAATSVATAQNAATAATSKAPTCRWTTMRHKTANAKSAHHAPSVHRVKAATTVVKAANAVNVVSAMTSAKTAAPPTWTKHHAS